MTIGTVLRYPRPAFVSPVASFRSAIDADRLRRPPPRPSLTAIDHFSIAGTRG